MIRTFDLTVDQLDDFILTNAFLFYGYANGKINPSNRSKGLYPFPSTRLFVKLLKEKSESFISGAIGIRTMFINYQRLKQYFHDHNMPLKRARSNIISVISHELSHLQQDTNNYHYDDATMGIEVPNIFHNIAFLKKHYREIQNILGPFDPEIEFKNSGYLTKEEFQEVNLEEHPYYEIKDVREAVINFLEPAFAIDFQKIFASDVKYLSIYHQNEFKQESKSLVRFPLSYLKGKLTPKKLVLVNALADMVDDMICGYRVHAYLNEDKGEKILEIIVNFDKHSFVTDHDGDTMGLLTRLHWSELTYFQDEFLQKQM